LLERDSFRRVESGHRVEEGLEVLVKVLEGFILDFGVLLPEVSIVSVHHVKEVHSSKDFIFGMREYTSALKQKEDDCCRVDVCGVPVLTCAIDEFGSSIECCSSGAGERLSIDAGIVKVCNFELEVLANQEIFKFYIKVGNTLKMKIFKPFNELMEIGAGEFLIEWDLMSHYHVKEISVRSQFHENKGDIFLILPEHDGFVSLTLHNRDHVAVFEGCETNFIEEIWFHASIFLERKYFYGVLGIVRWGISEEDRKIGFIEFFDDDEIVKVRFVYKVGCRLRLDLL